MFRPSFFTSVEEPFVVFASMLTVFGKLLGEERTRSRSHMQLQYTTQVVEYKSITANVLPLSLG